MRDKDSDLSGDESEGAGPSEPAVGVRRQQFRSRETERWANLHDPARTAGRIGLRGQAERLKAERKARMEIAKVLEDMKDLRIPERLAANLQTLLASRGLTLQEAVKTIPGLGDNGRAGYRWLKRLTRDGLSQISGRTKQRLEKIASFFGYTLEEIRSSDISLVREIEKFSQPPSEEIGIVGHMLLVLLADEKHCYLIKMLDALVPTETCSRTHAEAAGTTTSDLHLARCLQTLYEMPDSREQRIVCDLVRLLHKRSYLNNA